MNAVRPGGVAVVVGRVFYFGIIVLRRTVLLRTRDQSKSDVRLEQQTNYSSGLEHTQQSS